MHTERLRKVYRRIQDYVRYARDLEATGVATVSDFWTGFLSERPNFPDLNEITTFRRDGFSYGVGDYSSRDHKITAELDQRQFRCVEAMVLGTTPEAYLERFDEPLFGAPRFFETAGGKLFSQSFLTNLATSHEVTRAVETVGLEGPLRICEIGAGWGGCAYQLHQVLDVASYTIVDLPHNLNLSSSYLGMTLPDRTLAFVREDGQDREDGNVILAVPNFVEQVGEQFDVIINSFSLQEMAQNTVSAYMAWALRRLAPGGVFLFINAHDKAGPKRPSDYGLERFDIRRFSAFRKSPSGFLNSNPYLCYLTARTEDSPMYAPRHLDVLGQLVMLGLEANIGPLSEPVLAGEVSDATARVLAQLHEVLYERTDVDGKLTAVRAIGRGEHDAIASTLEAALQLVAMRWSEAAAAADRALSAGVSGLARSRVIVIRALALKRLGIFADSELPAIHRELQALSPSVFDTTLTLTPTIKDILADTEVDLMRRDLGSRMRLAPGAIPMDTHPVALLRRARSKAQVVLKQQLKRLGG